MKNVSRVFVASITAFVWIALFDGIARALSGSEMTTSIGAIASAIGCGILAGAIAGAGLALLVAAASVDGPARKATSGVLAGFAHAPVWALPIGVAVFLLPVAIAVPIRAGLFSENIELAAIVDLTSVGVGWALTLAIARVFGQKSGKRLSARAAGLVALGIGIAAAMMTARLRPNLESADLWNLILIGDWALVFFGAALLLPDSILNARFAAVLSAVAIFIGAAVLLTMQINDNIRERIASDWRPASWLVALATDVIDFDRDGYSPVFGGGDCDDGRFDVNPDGIEIAGNGVDENCRDGDTQPKLPWPPRPTFVERSSNIVEPKSIIIIVMDAVRKDHLGVYGYNRPTSPRIDAFSQKALRFSRAYSSAPTTRIAIPVLFTGRTLGEIPWDRQVYPYAVRDSVNTLPEILKEKLGFISAAFITHRHMLSRWGWSQGFDEINDKFVLPRSEYESASTGEGLAKEVVSWIEKHKSDRFFIWAHFLDAHSMYLKHPEGPDFGDTDIDRYDSEIWYTDRAIGTIFDKLDELNLSNETMVVLMADHGEFFGEHGRTAHGGSLWETLSRIPLFIRTPGLEPGVNDCLTGHVDLAPTILNIVGIDGGEYGMSGATLLPDMTGTPCPKNREIVLEMKYGRLSAPNMTALVGDRYKLLMNNSLRTFKLFDLGKDPDEMKNIAGSEQNVFANMKGRLLAWNESYANKELADIASRQISDALPKSAESVDAVFENGFEIAAIDFGKRLVSADESPDLQLFLRTKERVFDDCEIIFSLFDAKGDIRFESRHPPLGGVFPLRMWPVGKIVNDSFAFELRSKQMKNGRLNPGEYEARIGIACRGDEVPVMKGDDREDRIRAGKFRVVKQTNSEEKENGDAE